MTRPAVHFGTFDAESYWRPDDLAALPAFGGGGRDVEAMDELLAGFCAPGDLLITRHPMADAVRSGLAAAGITFELGDPGQELPAGYEPQPYAVLPQMGAEGLPSATVVAQVNSKSWSNELVRELGLPGAGVVVRSVEELVRAVGALGFRALVKDPYGVSGRALLEIPTPGVLRAIERVLRKQVEAGRRVELIVQEKFPKAYDFSGHLLLEPDGRWEFVGVQGMTNRGFRHLASGPLQPGLVDEQAYGETIARVVPALTSAGYWGPVGVDAMVLEDGSLIPVLEINARKSLGLLAVLLDRRVCHHGLRGHLGQLELNVALGKGIADVVAAIEPIAYRGGADPGVCVLSGSTLAAPGGRVYVGLFCPADEVAQWRQRLVAEVSAAGLVPRGMTDAAA
ncbi:hypothetical protein OG394_20525 [Kribbella sp. NBC_01245]|uniref:hypothetical protein n=1 Tax=Kribbella sp. NBC_01245 TaxID=2903578 RepID=UPI002E27B2FE|nr:hypothetical protein [Kribbella sp. NBC_01245]